MSWKFVPGDDFDLEYLKGLHLWFMKDLRASQSWFNEVQHMPDALSGKKEAIKIAKDDLKVSRDNIEKCIEAIRKTKETFNPLNGPKDKKV